MIRDMVSPDGTVKEKDREAIQFVKSKIDSAKWFISAIKQRHDTLMRTMRTILDFQREYFVDGDKSKLRPMILKDIADRTGLDVSTISRVVNSKYIQTPFGIILLKSLFSEGMQTSSGEEVSSYEIKKILQDCIDQEDKRHPLTDENLMDILNAKGYCRTCKAHGGQVPRDARHTGGTHAQADLRQKTTEPTPTMTQTLCRIVILAMHPLYADVHRSRNALCRLDTLDGMPLHYRLSALSTPPYRCC